MCEYKDLVKKTGVILFESGLTISTAESCTGGLIGHLLTNIPGSSQYYLGGIISYSNRIKTEILGVTEAALAKFGAVSHECVEQMAVGVRDLMKSNISLAVSGIAGPDGGSPEKPVGTVFFALADASGVDSVNFFFNGDRSAIKCKSAETALGLICKKVAMKNNF